MNALRRRGSLIVVSIVVVAMVAAVVVPATAQQHSEIQVTSSASDADKPDPAVDSKGNVHIAYDDDAGTGEHEIWYTMLDNNGNTLIAGTLLTPDDALKSRRPAIVVDSNDKVHIVWQDFRVDSDIEVFYTKLDPYLDDRDGGPADEATITLVQDKLISVDNDEYSMNPRMVADSDDNLHVVWEEYDVEIRYAKLDNNGNVLVGPLAVYVAVDFARAQPDVAVDSNGHPHITFCDENGTDTDEIYYMMLDGGDGSTLIGATRLTPDDNEYSKRPRIVVDSEDKVHIVFHDFRDSSTHEIYYTKLDPSLDDQDGGAADEAAITVVDDTALTPDDDNSSQHNSVAIGCGDTVHVTWHEYGTDDNVHYIVLDKNGDVVVAGTALSTTGDATSQTYWTNAYLEVDANGRAHITWCDDRTGNYEVWYTSYAPFSLTVNTSGGGTGRVTSDPPGIFCGADCTGNYAGVVTLTAHPGAKSYLVEWSGDCSGTELTTTVDMACADKTCTATFGYPVGGIVAPVNKLGLVAPWMGLASLMGVAAGAVAIRRRRG